MDIELGRSVDLLAGLVPDFASRSLPWRLPEGVPLITQPSSCPEDPVAWQEPVLSLHETVQDLLDHVFDYRVEPMVNLDGPLKLTTGVLTANKNMAGLEARTGLDLSRKPAPAYLLIRLRGVRATDFYEPYFYDLNRKMKVMNWLTPQGRKALARLRLSHMRQEGFDFLSDITAHQAKRYVSYFKDFGTHLISSLTYGEQLFQIFALTQDALELVRPQFAQATSSQMTGAIAVGMQPYLGKPWIEAASPILGACDPLDASVMKKLAAGKKEPEMPDQTLLSFCTLRADIQQDVLAGLSARHIIGVSFSCLGLYLEDFRADVWARILRGCFEQKIEKQIHSGWRKRRRFCPVSFFTESGLGAEDGVYSGVDQNLPELALAVELVTTPDTVIEASHESLWCFANMHPETGHGVVLSVKQAAQKAKNFKSHFVDGALKLVDPSGPGATLVDGVWIGTSKMGELEVVGAPLEIDDTFLHRHGERLSLYMRLLDEIQGPIFKEEVGRAMKSCVDWLLKTLSNEAPVSPLKWQAMQSAWGLGGAGLNCLPLAPKAKAAELSVMLSCALMQTVKRGNKQEDTLKDLRRQLRDFYKKLPVYVEPETVRTCKDKLALQLSDLFKKLSKEKDWTENVQPVIEAGMTVSAFPEAKKLPKARLSGESPEVSLWNSLLSWRTYLTQCEAILQACNEKQSQAVEWMEKEPMTAREVSLNAGEEFAQAITDLCGPQSAPITNVLDELVGVTHKLRELAVSAVLLNRINRLDVEICENHSGSQLQSLTLILELLNLSRWMGIDNEALEGMSLVQLSASITNVEAFSFNNSA